MLTPSRTFSLAGSISPRAVATRMPLASGAAATRAVTVTASAALAVAGNCTPDRAGCPIARPCASGRLRPCRRAMGHGLCGSSGGPRGAPAPRAVHIQDKRAFACQWAAATGNGPREGGLPRADCSILSRRATAQLHASHFGYLLPDKLETWSSSGATAAGQCKCSSEVES